jgi:hypothetical protein
MSKIYITVVSAHKDHLNFYSAAGERFRFQLARGLKHNRLRAGTVRDFMAANDLEFYSAVGLPLGTALAISEFAKVVENEASSILRFWLDDGTRKVKCLSNKIIRKMYAPLSLGWRDKPLKALIETGYIKAFGVDKYKNLLLDPSIINLDLCLMYLATNIYGVDDAD